MDEYTVSREAEFAVGDVLRFVLGIIVLGAVICLVGGDTETSAESLLILGVLGTGAVAGMIVTVMNFFSSVF